jgi:hypothetical protein
MLVAAVAAAATVLSFYAPVLRDYYLLVKLARLTIASSSISKAPGSFWQMTPIERMSERGADCFNEMSNTHSWQRLKVRASK